MDNRYNDQTNNPTQRVGKPDASGRDKRQEMINQRAFSSKPTTNTQYGSFYLKSNPSQGFSKQTGGGQAGGNLSSKYQIYSSFDQRG